MFIGINTDVSHDGETFHVQTEDGGLDQHTLTTILFKNGAIFSSKKSSYIDLSESPSYSETVKEMMQSQHQEMVDDLLCGKFVFEKLEEKDKQEVIQVSAAVSVEETSRKEGLDALIVEYLSKKKTG